LRRKRSLQRTLRTMQDLRHIPGEQEEREVRRKGTKESRQVWACARMAVCVVRQSLWVKLSSFMLLKMWLCGCWWLTPVILAIQEAEIRRITVRRQRSK
jgi:hypothetical protein